MTTPDQIQLILYSTFTGCAFLGIFFAAVVPAVRQHRKRPPKLPKYPLIDLEDRLGTLPPKHVWMVEAIKRLEKTDIPSSRIRALYSLYAAGWYAEVLSELNEIWNPEEDEESPQAGLSGLRSDLNRY